MPKWKAIPGTFIRGHDLSQTAFYVKTVDDLKQFNDNPLLKMFISASGMAAGGRVLHHLNTLSG